MFPKASEAFCKLLPVSRRIKKLKVHPNTSNTSWNLSDKTSLTEDSAANHSNSGVLPNVTRPSKMSLIKNFKILIQGELLLAAFHGKIRSDGRKNKLLIWFVKAGRRLSQESVDVWSSVLLQPQIWTVNHHEEDVNISSSSTRVGLSLSSSCCFSTLRRRHAEPPPKIFWFSTEDFGANVFVL